MKNNREQKKRNRNGDCKWVCGSLICGQNRAFVCEDMHVHDEVAANFWLLVKRF